MKKLVEIFFIFFRIGLFTVGGGYAMLPLIQREVVDVRGWMSDDEFLDAVSLTNSLPGPMAANTATFVGYRICKARGSLAAALGVTSPSIVIILLIAAVFSEITDYPAVRNFFSGITPAVAALILYAIISMAKSADIAAHLNWLVAAAAFCVITLLDVHPIIVIVFAALYGIFLSDKVRRLTGGASATNEDGASVGACEATDDASVGACEATDDASGGACEATGGASAANEDGVSASGGACEATDDASGRKATDGETDGRAIDSDRERRAD